MGVRIRLDDERERLPGETRVFVVRKKSRVFIEVVRDSRDVFAAEDSKSGGFVVG